jgi:hypothetical protein
VDVLTTGRRGGGAAGRRGGAGKLVESVRRFSGGRVGRDRLYARFLYDAAPSGGRKSTVAAEALTRYSHRFPAVPLPRLYATFATENPAASSTSRRVVSPRSRAYHLRTRGYSSVLGMVGRLAITQA